MTSWAVVPSGRSGLARVAPPMVADLVARDRPEPAAERIAGPFTAEIRDVPSHGGEHFLANIGGVRLGHPGASAPDVDGRAIQLGQAIPRAGFATPEPLQEACCNGEILVARRWLVFCNFACVFHGWARRVERKGIMSPCQGFMLTTASPRSREKSPTFGRLREIVKDRGVVSGGRPSPGHDG